MDIINETTTHTIKKGFLKHSLTICQEMAASTATLDRGWQNYAIKALKGEKIMVVPRDKYEKKAKDITNPQAVYNVFKSIIKAEHKADRDKEHFWTIGLNTRNSVKYIEMVSLGTLNASLVHPREVFRMAVMEAVFSIILVHNHPSGDPEPSNEDLNITRRLKDAGKIIGIELLDHVIVGHGEGSYASFKERGLV